MRQKELNRMCFPFQQLTGCYTLSMQEDEQVFGQTASTFGFDVPQGPVRNIQKCSCKVRREEGAYTISLGWSA
jgi:hypothetical protein